MYTKKNFDRILRLPEVCARTGRSRSAIYEDMQNGLFPLAVKLGPRAVGWSESEISLWVEKRIQDRDSQHMKGA